MELENTPEDKEERQEAIREAYRRNASNGHLPMARITWLDVSEVRETNTPMEEKPLQVESGGFLLEDINDGITRICQSYGEVDDKMKYEELLVVPDSLIINKSIIPEAS